MAKKVEKSKSITPKDRTSRKEKIPSESKKTVLKPIISTKIQTAEGWKRMMIAKRKENK